MPISTGILTGSVTVATIFDPQNPSKPAYQVSSMSHYGSTGSSDSRDHKDKRHSIDHILNPVQTPKSPKSPHSPQSLHAPNQYTRSPTKSPRLSSTSIVSYRLSPPETHLTPHISEKPPLGEHVTKLALISDQALKSSGERSVYTCVVHHHSRSVPGYGIFFGTNDPYNESGRCSTDKSVYRCELRAIARALHRITLITLADKNEQSPAQVDPSKKVRWTLNTSHEYSVKRVAGPLSPDSIEASHTRGAPCMDLVLYIRSLMEWLTSHNVQIQIELNSRNDVNMHMALSLAKDGAEGRGPTIQMPFPQLFASVPADEFQQVFTDGSTFLNDGQTTAGYGVYFGVYDPRNRCGPVMGKGTGPRASLAAMLRAIIAISKNHRGHRNWEIISCRGQYIKSIFELSLNWKRHGWKRNAGKPIASLDIYREARRVLDDLTSQGFNIRGRYVPQSNHNHGLMVADVMARHGAGDLSIELQLKSEIHPFEVPMAPEDVIPNVVHVNAHHINNDSTQSARWELNFGEGSPFTETGSFSASEQLCNCALYSLVRALRHIENGADRSWIIYCNNSEALTMLKENSHGKRKRSLNGNVESAITLIQRLNHHGYSLVFKDSSETSESGETFKVFVDDAVSPTSHEE